jgi:hypothetical protein
VAQAAEDWITSVGLEGREAATLVQYRQHARHIGKRIGNVKLAALTTPRINLFRDDLLATMSRVMARKVMSSLKSLLRDAQRRGQRRAERRSGRHPSRTASGSSPASARPSARNDSMRWPWAFQASLRASSMWFPCPRFWAG